MNGNPYSPSWIGATGQYPIYDYVNQVASEVSSNSSNFTISNSNILETHLANTSNILQTQITATSDIIHTDNNSNVIIRLVAQNPNYHNYPLTETPKEMLFETTEGEVKTKITQDGELMVYHPLTPLPEGFGPGWWGVENKIANLITDTIGLRFDVTGLQAATGTTAITETSSATAAAAGAAAGAAAATATTAAAGTAIAQGDYGTVALGVAGGALFSVLGYLSYQAQVKSNLTSNGFTTQAAQVQSNIDTANLLLTENISNIVLAKGFVNSNFLFAQKYLSSNAASNIFVASNVLSNLNISQGFINTNITTQQTIPDISSTNFTAVYANINNIYNKTEIDSRSNILNDKIDLRSNILNDKIDLRSNILNDKIDTNQTYISSNYANNIRLKLPNTNFTYDSSAGIYVYDLNISLYVPFKLIQQSSTLFIKTRIFRITTFLSTDFNNLQNTNLNNLTGSPICFPETLLIYMSNDKNTSGIHTADDNYCNGLIYGKQNPNIYSGYWNIVPTNFNYIRFITGVGFDMNVIIEPILF